MRWAWFFIPFILASMAIGFIINYPWGQRFSAQTKLCDQQVPILLHTHDPVDLRRAIFLVRWLNCSVSKRLNEKQNEQ